MGGSFTVSEPKGYISFRKFHSEKRRLCVNSSMDSSKSEEFRIVNRRLNVGGWGKKLSRWWRPSTYSSSSKNREDGGDDRGVIVSFFEKPTGGGFESWQQSSPSASSSSEIVNLSLPLLSKDGSMIKVVEGIFLVAASGLRARVKVRLHSFIRLRLLQ